MADQDDIAQVFHHEVRNNILHMDSKTTRASGHVTALTKP
jgi:hypothetical protein